MVGESHPIAVNFKVVRGNIPPLLGLEDIMELGIVIDPKGRRIFTPGWWAPLSLENEHLVVNMGVEGLDVLFTRGELQKVHNAFGHLSPRRMEDLLRRIGPVDGSTKKQIQTIVSECDPCQRHATRPLRFKVSAGPEDVRFNHEVAVDIAYLDNVPLLHVVDIHTRLQAAAFLESVSARHTWEALKRIWIYLYGGPPNVLRVDQGSNFQSETFKESCGQFGIRLQQSGVEHHNALGAGESYHAPLRRLYQKLKVLQPDETMENRLAMAVYQINQAPVSGHNGISPFMSALGADLFRGPMTRCERDTVIAESRNEARRSSETSKVRRALRTTTPKNIAANLDPGQLVLVYRETSGEYEGPFKLESCEDKVAKVLVPNSNGVPVSTPFSVTAVRPYRLPSVADISGFAETHLRRCPDTATVHLTRIIEDDSPEAHSKDMLAAKQEEIKSLYEKGTFKVVLREELPPKANMLDGRYVLSIKDDRDGREVSKARYIIRGHRDKEKNWLVNSSTNMRSTSLRMIFALSALLGLRIWSDDITKAYIQSKDILDRKVYLDPKGAAEFNLTKDEVLQVMRPLYGLTDSGDRWFSTIDLHVKEKGGTPLKTDASTYKLAQDGITRALLGLYVDDLVVASTKEAADELDIQGRFNTKGLKWDQGDVLGVSFKTTGQGIEVDQAKFAASLLQLSEPATFHEIRSARAKLAWIGQTNPEVAQIAARLSQVTAEQFEASPKEIIGEVNDGVRRAKEHCKILFPKLQGRVRILVYTDASFASNRDLSSQGGYVVLLADEHGKVAPLDYKSFKTKRVCRSTLTAEALAMVAGIDTATALGEDVSTLVGYQVPVLLLIDSKCLFDAIATNGTVKEKRLQIDIASAQELHLSGGLNIAFVRSADNLADALTKTVADHKLRDVLASGRHVPVIAQSVVRSTRRAPDPGSILRPAC